MARHYRGAHFMDGVARLRDGVPAERAEAELSALSARLGKQFANTNGGWVAHATPLHVEVVGFFRPALYVLLGAVSLLLVIACVNVASLMLARSTVREREVAIRAAIGATRARLVRQFLTESALLAMLGSIAGDRAGGRRRAAARHRDAGADSAARRGRARRARARASRSAVAAATAIGFGLLPALFLSSVDSQQTLKESTRTTTSRRRERTRRLLVVAEIGLAVMLLFGAGLLIRTVSNLSRQDPGFARAAAAAERRAADDGPHRERAAHALLVSEVGTGGAVLRHAARSPASVQRAGSGRRVEHAAARLVVAHAVPHPRTRRDHAGRGAAGAVSHRVGRLLRIARRAADGRPHLRRARHREQRRRRGDQSDARAPAVRARESGRSDARSRCRSASARSAAP